jgi:hypothetical protein
MPVQKDVVIAMPAYDNKTEFEISDAITNAINDPECPVSGRILYSGDSLVNRARNECVLQFEEMPIERARFLVFIDSDIHFKPEQITKLRSHNLPIVAGMYFIKNLKYTPVLNQKIATVTLPTGTLTQVREVGTGFLMIRRDTFGALKDSGHIKSYRAGANQHNLSARRWNYFPVEVEDDYLQSEDYAFCRNCAKVNIPTYVDSTVIAGHKGWAIYPLPLSAVAESLVAGMSVMIGANSHSVTQKHIDDILKAWEHYKVASGIEAKAEPVPLEKDVQITYVSKPPTENPTALGGA